MLYFNRQKHLLETYAIIYITQISLQVHHQMYHTFFTCHTHALVIQQVLSVMNYKEISQQLTFCS